MPSAKKMKKSAAHAAKVQKRKEQQRRSDGGNALKFGQYVNKLQTHHSAIKMMPKATQTAIHQEMSGYNSIACASAVGKPVSMSGFNVMTTPEFL